MKRNNLDEMQEQELLKIEHNGCWLAFWLLLASLFVQYLLSGGQDLRTVAGEWIVFMILCLYLAIACVRKGIWDRRFAMNTKTNLILSLIAGAAVGLISGVGVYRNWGKAAGSAAVGALNGLLTAGLCLAALTVAMRVTARRQKAMEAEPEDADELDR